jgi:3-deoxy-D-manno-octulosonate 8-phosphate phosphatase (KDO 8-P phosphatase)
LTLADRCRAIELLVLDVDGVLSDGGIAYTDPGVESKEFFVRDGSGIKLWRRAGKRVALLSGRAAQTTLVRAKELGVDAVVQDADDKRPGFARLLRDLQVEPRQVAYLGDDVPDVPILQQCGLAAAVADACPDVLRVAHFVGRAPGGRGAVRELIELILRCQGLWRPW